MSANAKGCPECGERVDLPGVVHRMPCSLAATEAERLLLVMVTAHSQVDGEPCHACGHVDGHPHSEDCADETARAYLTARGLLPVAPETRGKEGT